MKNEFGRLETLIWRNVRSIRAHNTQGKHWRVKQEESAWTVDICCMNFGGLHCLRFAGVHSVLAKGLPYMVEYIVRAVLPADCFAAGGAESSGAQQHRELSSISWCEPLGYRKTIVQRETCCCKQSELNSIANSVTTSADNIDNIFKHKTIKKYEK